MSRCWLVLVVLLVTQPRAEARRESACEAPVQTLKADEERAIEAQVEAEAKAVGKAKAASRAGLATQYATTLANQDDIARQYSLYQWCRQYEAKLIDYDFYKEMVRHVEGLRNDNHIAEPVVRPAGSPDESAATSPGQELAIDDLLGTWEVRLRFRGAICPEESERPGTYVRSWRISDQNGELRVQSETIPNTDDCQTWKGSVSGNGLYLACTALSDETLTVGSEDAVLPTHNGFMVVASMTEGGHLEGDLVVADPDSFGKQGAVLMGCPRLYKLKACRGTCP